jgi:hypothetical protein
MGNQDINGIIINIVHMQENFIKIVCNLGKLRPPKIRKFTNQINSLLWEINNNWTSWDTFSCQAGPVSGRMLVPIYQAADNYIPKSVLQQSSCLLYGRFLIYEIANIKAVQLTYYLVS